MDGKEFWVTRDIWQISILYHINEVLIAPCNLFLCKLNGSYLHCHVTAVLPCSTFIMKRQHRVHQGKILAIVRELVMKLIMLKVEQKYCRWLSFSLEISFINRLYSVSFISHTLNWQENFYKHSSLLQYFLLQFLFISVLHFSCET